MNPLGEELERLERQGRELFARVAEGERRYRRMARAVWQVQEQERRSLARDLHDGLGQNLTAVKTQLEWISRTTELPAEAADRIRDIVEVVAAALQETRELSRLLRPSMLDDLGLEPALHWLARTMGCEGDPRCRISVEVEGLEQRFDGDLETLIFRIAQEAVTNAVRHSGASRITIHVVSDPERLVLTIIDDGCGFDPGKVAREGSGLRGMRDRSMLFGGHLSVLSSNGRGSRIELRLPPVRRREDALATEIPSRAGAASV